MSYEGFISPVAEFFGYSPDNVIQGRTGRKATEPTLLDRVLGVTGEELKASKKADDQFKTEKRFRPQFVDEGIDFETGKSGPQYSRILQEHRASKPTSAESQLEREQEETTHQRGRETNADMLQLAMLERGLKRDAQEAADRRADRALDREMQMYKIDADKATRKQELFQALFGLGSAFMI